MEKQVLIREQGQEVIDFVSKYFDISNSYHQVIKTAIQFNVDILDKPQYNCIVNFNKVNDIRYINSFQKAINEKLADNGIYIGLVETYEQRQQRLKRKFKPIIAQFYILLDFIFKRVFPKFSLFRGFYFFITGGRNRAMSKAETLGRVQYSGFDIVEIKNINNHLYFVAKKKFVPDLLEEVSYGLLFKMKRIGKNGQPITVYKIRTMHPYAEYLQQYVYEQNSLKEGGKFNDDFRITSWGKVFRKFWIDEIPMIYNIIKGEIKLVGVRPLSKHYLSLYTEEFKNIRNTIKPGLLPPFYADMPKTLDEIIYSEMNYIKAYQARPLKTDFSYFVAILKNILFKNARTQ